MGGNGRFWAVWGGMAAGAVVVGGAAYRPVTAHYRADIHTEYVKFPSGRDTITAYLAYPERKDPAPVVVVIHEIFWMSDFIRQTTEQLAKDGFVAIAPDLLSRRGGTPPSPDDARKLIAGLDPDMVTGSRRDGGVRQADQGGPGRPGGRHWLLLGRRPELPLRHQQPVPWRVRRLLRAGSRRHVHRTHPRQGTRRLRREGRAHQRRPCRCGRGHPDVPQDLPLYRVSRRRPRFPASP